MRYHYAPNRTVKIQNTDSTKCEMTGTLIAGGGGGEMQNGKATLDDSLAASYKTKHTLTNPVISPLGIYSKELKTYVHTKTCTSRLQQLYSELPKLGSKQDVLQ